MTEQLDALVARVGARSISCFLSTTTEPGTREFVERGGPRHPGSFRHPDGRPARLGGRHPEIDITEGMFGLPEPVGELLGPIAVNSVDLLVIPAAAVDRSGMRLGWGRGFFDKTIGSMERCLRCTPSCTTR